MQCNNCGSYDCVSNKLDAVGMIRAIRGAHPGLTNVGSATILASLYVGNKLRKDWVCTNCGYKF